jgi:hypothetical protein
VNLTNEQEGIHMLGNFRQLPRISRTQGLLALAGTGLLLFGVATGIVLGGHFTAQAASTGHAAQAPVTGQGFTEYCQIYENALAADLNVSTSIFEHDNVDAIHKTLDSMVHEGEITSFEETQALQLLQQIGTQPCTHLNAKSITSFLSGDTALLQQALAARTALVSAVAKSLGISSTTLESDLQHGQTVAQIAGQRHVALASVRTAYLSTAKTYLAQAVSQGLITQPQSDLINNMLAKAVNGGAFPLLSLQS